MRPVNGGGGGGGGTSQIHTLVLNTVKPVLRGHSKKNTKIGFQDQMSLNAGQKYCRMLQGEHSAILSTFIKLPFVIKNIVLSIFEWLLKTGFTVPNFLKHFYIDF